MSESFAELFAESLETTNLRVGAIVIGTVVSVDRDFVTVNAGLKSEGVIPAGQFLDKEGDIEVAEGDQVEVILETVEDGWGCTRLSREKAKRHYAWKSLEQSFANEDIIIGMITGKVKGGFTVELDQLRGFLPGSLVDMRPVRDTTHLENQDLEFKIIKLDQKRNNVVLSRRAVIEAEYNKERERLLEHLAEGQEMKGIVKNLTDYGAFVDLGGIDGLLHITDMAWRRVKHPSEVVQIGDEVHVRILKFDREKMRVSLGIKQTTEDPWLNLKRRYPVSSRLFGKVTNITDYGAFVGIEDGVEGLVHVSEMDWSNKNVNPSKLVESGQEVEVMVLEIDTVKRRVSLGL
ncbi:MAG: 30S ribosomal protein S1, partial [Pseudomonadota bacterium]